MAVAKDARSQKGKTQKSLNITNNVHPKKVCSSSFHLGFLEFNEILFPIIFIDFMAIRTTLEKIFTKSLKNQAKLSKTSELSYLVYCTF